jgi:LPXTG-motif cell wall-anchored protein
MQLTYILGGLLLLALLGYLLYRKKSQTLKFDNSCCQQCVDNNGHGNSCKIRLQDQNYCNSGLGDLCSVISDLPDCTYSPNCNV